MTLKEINLFICGSSFCIYYFKNSPYNFLIFFSTKLGDFFHINLNLLRDKINFVVTMLSPIDDPM